MRLHLGPAILKAKGERHPIGPLHGRNKVLKIGECRLIARILNGVDQPQPVGGERLLVKAAANISGRLDRLLRRRHRQIVQKLTRNQGQTAAGGQKIDRQGQGIILGLDGQRGGRQRKATTVGQPQGPRRTHQ